jgi:hypothetical protein
MNLSLALSLGLSYLHGHGGAEPVAPFDPATLFGEGDQGGVYDFTNESTLFKDTGMTEPVTTPGDLLYAASDLSGNDNHLTRRRGSPRWQGMPATWGPNLVTSPLFEDGADWTQGTGWSVSAGVATKTAGTASAIEQTVSLEAGSTYMVVVRVASCSDGKVWARFTGGNEVSHKSGYDAAGEYIEILTAVNGNTTIGVYGNDTFAGTVNVVQVRKVLSFYDMGAKADGNERLRSEEIDMSATNEMTIIVSGIRGRRDGNMIFGQVAGSATGNGERLDLSDTIGAQGRDGVDDDVVTANDPDLSVEKRGHWIYAVRRDTNEALIADQHQIQFNGVDLAQSNNGGPFVSPTTNPSNAKICLMSWLNMNAFFFGTIFRVIVINRRLSDGELAQAVEWCGQRFSAAAIVGDSTWERDSPTEGIGRGVASTTGTMLAGVASLQTLASWGDDTTEQNTKWSAMTSTELDQLGLVVVGTGLNDIAGRVDSGATVPQILTDLQNLIDEIKSDCPSAKIVGAKLHDVEGWLDGRTNAADCKAAHTAWNAALTDGTITGLDAVATAHLDLMNDGSGYITDLIGTGPDGVADGVHPGEYGRYCMNVALREALVNISLAEPSRIF